jgi:serine/threonine protein kinase
MWTSGSRLSSTASSLGQGVSLVPGDFSGRSRQDFLVDWARPIRTAPLNRPVSKLPSVIGRYQIRSRLGQGGMGYLFLAWDPVLEREVAIKRLRDDNDELRERFAREARSVARLRHPNIVTIYDVGEQDGEPFIAMEYIVGQTMAEIIRARAPLEVTRKLEIIRELCDGLAFAHKAGIVHRDVKPANIIVEPEGSIKILDFGIARIAESGMTQAGMLIGTLNYMSPEQVAGRVVDSRSDIFAVGAVFYELLRYQQAFPGGLHNGILNKILNEPPPSLETACPGLDSEVIAIVDRALQKAPESRYQDLASMRKDLERTRQRLESLPKEALPSQTARPSLAHDTATAPPSGPRPTQVAGREENARQKEIVAQLDNAYGALAAADFNRADAEVRQVLALSPELAEAVELQDRIRIERANHQVQQWLERAQALLDSGAVSEAQAVAEQALNAAPGLPAAVRLEKAIAAAQQAIDQERQRAEALKAALERAASLLNEGSFEAAEQAVAEALALSPDNENARALQQRIRRAINEHMALERRVDDAHLTTSESRRPWARSPTRNGPIRSGKPGCARRIARVHLRPQLRASHMTRLSQSCALREVWTRVMPDSGVPSRSVSRPPRANENWPSAVG